MFTQPLYNKAVFLDRDGVLNWSIVKNGKPYPPSCVEELVIFDDALCALSQLKIAGFFLFVVTNQPDVIRGKINKNVVEKINSILKQHLPIDEFFVCYHDDSDHCLCRKPKSGLLLEAAQKYNIEIKKSFMIGDRWRDVEAGNQINCKTVWLNYGYQEKRPLHPNFTTTKLSDAVCWILNQE